MSDRAKWDFLQRAPAADARDPELARLAGALAAVSARARQPARAFAHLAACVARDCIRYERDTARTGGEDIAGLTRPPAPALEAFRRGVDDCDAKARLFCALCLAAGTRARMVPLWRGDELQHVSAEVLLDGQWEPVELTLARARVGDRPKDVPREGDGQWLRT